jgi:DNA-binding PucR family transcriptional regulator
VDVKLLNDKLAGTAPVHVALGELASGLAGFRSSHRDALRARAVAEAGLHTAPSVVEFEHVAIAALMSDNLEDLGRWVTRTLGELARDDESMARLRETVRVFLQCGGSYTDAAALLHLHKNTVNYRARKAEEAIGHPLTERRLDIEVALLVADVLGVQVIDPS